MPVLRYFVFVGGALLALLLVVSACLPTSPVEQRSAASVDRSVIRIQSNHRWPDRVVFDTTLQTITPATSPAAMTTAEAPSQQAAGAAPQGRAREAFAQAINTADRPELKRKRKSVAKNRAAPQRILVAQQPSPFFFGNVW